MDEPARSESADTASNEKSVPLDDQSGYSESDETVLNPTAALYASELPAGMTPRELAVALEGEQLDKFQLQQFVGGGGMGVVFKALDTTLDRVVAVKVVASRSISNEDLQRRFLIEAQSAARLDHPNIARVYDSGRCRGLPYIVFEYIEGINIRDMVVSQGPLSLGEALSFSYQIAHALTHAWQREVVHRDIKPSNILVNQEGQAKLVDMGLARLYQVGTPEEDLTSTGVTLGTFDYISPEQARDPRLADARSDIYSLGCTLFYMLAGHAPFSEGTAAQKLLQHQEEKPPELTEIRDDVPDSLDRLVGRMLAKRPEDRPQTSSEVVTDLASIMRELGLHLPHALSPLPSAIPMSGGPSWQRHIPWAVPLAVLLGVTVWMSVANENIPKGNPFPEFRKPDSTQEQTDTEAVNDDDEAAPVANQDSEKELNRSEETSIGEGEEKSEADTLKALDEDDGVEDQPSESEEDSSGQGKTLDFDPEENSPQEPLGDSSEKETDLPAVLKAREISD